MICHAKKKHLPVVFLQFVRRVGVWPRVLVSDGTDTRSAHHENGPAERAVQEIDAMIRASIVSSGIPMKDWCFVAEHMSLVDAMTSYSTTPPKQFFKVAKPTNVPGVFRKPNFLSDFSFVSSSLQAKQPMGGKESTSGTKPCTTSNIVFDLSLVE